jgi:hypothetical protein
MMKKLLATAMLYGMSHLGMVEDFASSYYFENETKSEISLSGLEKKFDGEFIETKNFCYPRDLEGSFEKGKYEVRKISEVDFSKIPPREYMKKEDVREIVDSLYTTMRVPNVISKEFFMAAVENESRFNKNAVSPVGARGLAQIMPETWGQYNPYHNFEIHSFDPVLNLKTGIQVYTGVYNYVRKNNPNWEILSNEDKLGQIIAGYNWGIGRLKETAEWDLNRLPRETKGYIDYVFRKLS